MPAANSSSAYTNTGVTIGSRPMVATTNLSRPIALGSHNVAATPKTSSDAARIAAPLAGGASESSSPAARSGMRPEIRGGRDHEAERRRRGQSRPAASRSTPPADGAGRAHARAATGRPWRRPSRRSRRRPGAARTGDRDARTTDGTPRGSPAAPTSRRSSPAKTATTPIADQTNVSSQRSNPASRTAVGGHAHPGEDAEHERARRDGPAGDRAVRARRRSARCRRRWPPIRSAA